MRLLNGNWIEVPVTTGIDVAELENNDGDLEGSALWHFDGPEALGVPDSDYVDWGEQSSDVTDVYYTKIVVE